MSELNQPLRDSDGFAVPAPPAKRQLRPFNSGPTTSEIYGLKHGIPTDVQRALENVGRRGREAVSRGIRTFDRTQSVPNLAPGDTAAPPFASFTTTHDAMKHARSVINKEIMRAREVKPFGDLSPQSASGSGLSEEAKDQSRWRKLQFGPDGEVEEIVLGKAPRKGDESRFGDAQNSTLVQNRKRRSSPAEPEGSDTETDDIEEDEPQAHVERGPFARFNSDRSVFPPVFSSSSISQPELFGPISKVESSEAESSASSSGDAFGRAFKALPGGKKLDWAKSASAPVIGLQKWGGMEIDGEQESAKEGKEMEDGFEFNNWDEVEF